MRLGTLLVMALLGSASASRAADLILNEYNAVGKGRLLGSDGADTFWQQIEGNGGDWVELVVIKDHLDIRGWRLEVSDGEGRADTLTFSQHDVWSDLRSGTILTVSEELANNVSAYLPAVGSWWINVSANSDTDGTYITPTTFATNNHDWQLNILDGDGEVVFGPAGEAVHPFNQIGPEEVFRLEEDPTDAITPMSNYDDGTTSTFGAPNEWDDGAGVQDFSALRSVVPYTPLTSVRINEVLTHTDMPDEDWIELFNTTNNAIDVSGWFLSDDRLNLRSFRIPDGTVIGPKQYRVFDESELNFALSASEGDEVFLSVADQEGDLTGARDFIRFGPAINGQSLGRFPNGSGNVYRLSERTRGGENADPVVGPAVISEIMYDYQADDEEQLLEFIELTNTLGEPFDLFVDFANRGGPLPWRLDDAVRFDFPLDAQVPACGALLVVPFDPVAEPDRRQAFVATYGLDDDAPMIGPYSGKLNNLGERVVLLLPDTPQGPGPDEGMVPYVLVDEVSYLNRSPWPVEAAGMGRSLERRDVNDVGDLVSNWSASTVSGGSPGARNTTAANDICVISDNAPDSDDEDDIQSINGGSRRGFCGAGLISGVGIALALALALVIIALRQGRGGSDSP